MKDKITLERPTLIIVAGPSCSGKTTYAERIIESVNLTYIDKDPLLDVLMGEDATRDDSQAGLYDLIKPKSYALVYAIAEMNLNRGGSALIDAPNTNLWKEETQRQLLREMIERTGSQLRLILCYTPPEVIERRMRERGLKRDAWKFQPGRWEPYIQGEFDTFYRGEVPLSPNMKIDTTRGQDENLERIIQFLQL